MTKEELILFFLSQCIPKRYTEVVVPTNITQIHKDIWRER